MRGEKTSSGPAPHLQTRYSPLWIEALAYHEAGHAVMALVLGIRVARIAIAEACDLDDSNGLTEYADLRGVSPLKYALCQLASEPAEGLAPNYTRFSRLRGFAAGRRNDKALAFQAFVPIYHFMRLAESTARQVFRNRTRPLLSRITGQPENQAVVREAAAFLMARKEMKARMISRFGGRTVLPAEVLSEL